MSKPWQPVAASLLLLGSLAQAAQYRVPVRVSGPTIAAPIVITGMSLASPLSLTPLSLTPALSHAPQLSPALLSPAVSLAAPAPIPSIAVQENVANTLMPMGGSALNASMSAVQSLQKSVVSPSAILASLYDGQVSAVAVQASPVALPGRNIIGSPHAQTQYLASAQTKVGKALLEDLHEASGKNYTAHEYGEAKSYMFSTSDNITVNGKHGLIDAYSGVFVPGTSGNGGDYREPGDVNHDGHTDTEGMNVEHTWPQSFFDKRLPMKSDLHHLLPTFVHPNGVRGHLPFGEVKGQGDYHNDGGAKSGQGVFEPPDLAKGKVARAVLYFYTRYYDRNITNGAYNEQAFWSSKLEMFMRWNKQFPPDEMELRRNDLIEKFQGNRNPFIDDPTLADRIGLDGFQRAGKMERLSTRQANNQPFTPRNHRRR